MDKRKIYIAVIVFCVIASGAVLYWSGAGSPAQDLPQDFIPVNRSESAGGGSARSGSSQIPTLEESVTYNAPSVFPANPKIDLGVFVSSEFQNLIDYVPISVSPEEIGRENPYQPF